MLSYNIQNFPAARQTYSTPLETVLRGFPNCIKTDESEAHTKQNVHEGTETFIQPKILPVSWCSEKKLVCSRCKSKKINVLKPMLKMFSFSSKKLLFNSSHYIYMKSSQFLPGLTHKPPQFMTHEDPKTSSFSQPFRRQQNKTYRHFNVFQCKMPHTEHELSNEFWKIPSSFLVYFFHNIALLKCFASYHNTSCNTCVSN